MPWSKIVEVSKRTIKVGRIIKTALGANIVYP